MNTFEYNLIRHCAPTLVGIKQANLFSCPKDERVLADINKYNSLLNKNGIYLEILYSCQRNFYIFAYREKMLVEYLNNRQVQYFLGTSGYPKVGNSNLKEILAFLEKRILTSEDFPHEIGFFLGYPLNDVLSFIKNKGYNYKICGYWKVYNNVETAKRIFSEYKSCSDLLLEKATNGDDILNLVQNY